MSEEMTRRFLARLWELQTAAGLRDAALARLLGCDQSYIRHLKAGRRKRLGLRIALEAVRHFPELRDVLLAEFPQGNDTVMPGNDEEPQQP